MKRSGNLFHRQKTNDQTSPSEASSSNVDRRNLSKQDSIPRRPLRDNSPERNIRNATLVPKPGGLRSSEMLESVSDLSVSVGSLGSFSSFFSSTDGSAPNLHSSGETSSSTLNVQLRRKFSTSSRLSLFSSQPPEKKKNKKIGKKESKKLNRWDSSEECKAKFSPQKPQRKGIAHEFETPSCMQDFSLPALRRMPPQPEDSPISRWTSQSTSQHDVIVSPRKIGSPRKPTRAELTATPRPPPPPPPLRSAPRRETNRDQDIEFNPKLLFSHLQNKERSDAGLPKHRAVLSRQPKAYNLLLKKSSPIHPPSTPRLPPWNPNNKSNADSLHKLKCPFEWAGSKRSVATSITQESTASSAACPDYSIPWFAPPQHQKVGQ